MMTRRKLLKLLGIMPFAGLLGKVGRDVPIKAVSAPTRADDVAYGGDKYIYEPWGVSKPTGLLGIDGLFYLAYNAGLDMSIPYDEWEEDDGWIHRRSILELESWSLAATLLGRPGIRAGGEVELLFYLRDGPGYKMRGYVTSLEWIGGWTRIVCSGFGHPERRWKRGDSAP